MTTQHTQGPWGLSSTMSSDFQGIRYITDQDGNHIAKVLYINEKKQEELLANARLIAAAPELLEALKWALENLGDDLDPDFQTAKKHCEMIVKKAEGESGEN